MRLLVPVEIEVEADEGTDPRLLKELVSAILDDGFRTYATYGDIDPYTLIDVYISPEILVEGTVAEDRDKRVERLKRFWQHLSYRRAENHVPGKQLDLPGLEVPR